jgi:hypothetical protein
MQVQTHGCFCVVVAPKQTVGNPLEPIGVVHSRAIRSTSCPDLIRPSTSLLALELRQKSRARPRIKQSGKIYCHSELVDDLDLLPDDIDGPEKFLRIPDRLYRLPVMPRCGRVNR